MKQKTRRRTDRIFGKRHRIHFVGIGGSGMSGIAEVLLTMKHEISGSDIKESPVLERLRQLGATIRIGHEAENVGLADVVVTSSAVSSDNPEVLAARAKKIPVIPRAEMLAELMRLKYSITVAGAHGKTTTTSMIGLLLHDADFDPTVIIGGRLRIFESNARAGSGEFIVVEADESDRSFLKLSPTIAIITNIDAEHLDHYKDLEDIKQSFVTFANKVPFYGSVILCLDDPHNRSILPQIERQVVTYGLTPEADFYAVPLGWKGYKSEFEVYHHGVNLGIMELNVPGLHSVLNSLAAIAVASRLGISFDTARESLAHFTGVDRRFQFRCEVNDIIVIDDYAHHPNELRTTLKAARQGWNRRIVAVFQPHRYTRLLHLFNDFKSCFDLADVLVLTDVYPAGEQPIEGVSAERLAQAMSGIEVIFHKDLETLPQKVLSLARPGDMLLFLGAGSITTVADKTARLLQGTRSDLEGQFYEDQKKSAVK